MQALPVVCLSGTLGHGVPGKDFQRSNITLAAPSPLSNIDWSRCPRATSLVNIIVIINWNRNSVPN